MRAFSVYSTHQLGVAVLPGTDAGWGGIKAMGSSKTRRKRTQKLKVHVPLAPN